jgi:hypothetical protein
MDITAVLALAVLVGMLVGLAAYVTVFQKQQPQQQQRAAPDEDEEPVQVWLLALLRLHCRSCCMQPCRCLQDIHSAAAAAVVWIAVG